MNFAEYLKGFDTLEEALEAALNAGHKVNKRSDPTEGERLDLAFGEALEIAKEDVNLLWLSQGE